MDLVLGAVAGYGIDELRPFVSSLKRAGFHGDTVLLSSGLSKTALDWLCAEDVRVVPLGVRGVAINSWSRFWPRLRPFASFLPEGRLQRKVLGQLWNLLVVRHVFAHDFLRKNRHKYSRVFWTDVRDVVFQRSPFELELKSDFEAFEESRQLCMRNCPFNSQRIEERFGTDSLAQIGDFPILCAGTSRATTDRFIEYQRRYIRMAIRSRTQLHMTDSGWSGTGDQAIHNMVMRFDSNGLGVSTIENGSGTVATLGHELTDNISISPEGLVLGSAGDVIPVVHQYDRHPELAHSLPSTLTGSK